MTDALSYQACAAVKALVERITIAGGFNTDIGTNVSLEDDYVANPKVVSTWVGEADITELESSRTSRTSIRTSALDIAIEVTVPTAPAMAWRTAHGARADILAAVSASALATPQGVTGLTLKSRKIIRRPDGAACVIVQVVYITNLTETIPAPP